MINSGNGTKIEIFKETSGGDDVFHFRWGLEERGPNVFKISAFFEITTSGTVGIGHFTLVYDPVDELATIFECVAGGVAASPLLFSSTS